MCCNNKVDNLSMVVKTKRKTGVVRSKSADNKQNQFQWQEVVKRNKFPTNGENGHLAFGVRNTDCNDGNPISTPIMNSLRGYKRRGTCIVLDQRIIDSNTAICETIKGQSIQVPLGQWA
jgi:hypothetical protein